MTSTARNTQARSIGRATAPPPAGDGAPAAGKGEVEIAVERDIAGLAIRSPELAKSGLAASALNLARRIDSPKTSATAASMCQRALRETFDRLLELAPTQDKPDGLDALVKRSERKLSRSAAPKD